MYCGYVNGFAHSLHLTHIFKAGVESEWNERLTKGTTLLTYNLLNADSKRVLDANEQSSKGTTLLTL